VAGRHRCGRRAQQEVGLYNYLGHDAHVPGGRLAGESWSDIHLHNYNAAIRVLQKAAPLGNKDAMDCLAYCYFFGNGVPVDRIRQRNCPDYWNGKRKKSRPDG
jgi:TPR repeat protein